MNLQSKPRTGWKQRQRLKLRLMDFTIGTWNVRTLNRPGAVKDLLQTLSNYKIKILAIQETKWHGTDPFDMKTHTIFPSGKQIGRKEFGVAFIVEKEMKPNVIGFQPIDERICTLRVKTKFNNLYLINAHAPHEGRDDNDKDEFYQKLERIYDSAPSNDIKIVIGDLNAKIGRETHYQGTIGKHSLHERCDNNGHRFVDFAAGKNMSIRSTYFKHKNIHKRTWQSADESTFNQIDHVAADKRWATSIIDVRSYRGACCGSDHYLVAVKFRCRVKLRGSRRQNIEPRINTKVLEIEEKKEEYQIAITRNLQSMETTNLDVNDRWTKIKEAVLNAGEMVLGHERRHDNREWFDTECKNALDLRNEAYKILQQRPTRIRREEYRKLRKKADKICRKKKREALNQALMNINENARNNNTRMVYQEIKRLRQGFKPRTDLCKNKDGKVLAEREEIKARWKEYFEELLNDTQNSAYTDTLNEVNNGRINRNEQVEEPTFDELLQVIHKLKNNKAPGIDGIPAELLKKGGDSLTSMLYDLVLQIWRDEVLPEEWRFSIICPVYKKGDKLECKNYRGISLLCVAYKIFTALVRLKLEPFAKRLIGEYQAGFRQGRSTIDQLYTVRQILAKCWEFDVDVFQIFIDFRQAYDKIQREKLYKILNDFGIPMKLVSLIKHTMTNTRAKVKIENELTDELDIKEGLKQGDGLAPMLFNLALEYVIRKLQIDVNGNLLYKSSQIVAYADDVNILARKESDIREQYVKLETAAKEVGLCINVDKTKAMQQTRNKRTRRRLGQNMTIGDDNIEVVENFTYLGSVISDNNDEMTEVKKRISFANKAYYGLLNVFKSNNVHRKTKLRLYKTIVRPVLTYGAETWTLTHQAAESLNIFERKVLRRILGPINENDTWRIRYNRELYQIYDDPEVATIIRLSRLRWAGHIQRMSEERIPRKVLHRRIPDGGARPRGRPRDRWRDSVDEDAATLLNVDNWYTAAVDRDSWRQTLKSARARYGL